MMVVLVTFWLKFERPSSIFFDWRAKQRRGAPRGIF